MKTCLLIVSCFVSLTLMNIMPGYAQDTLNSWSKRALFIIYDGASFREAGFKYKLSNPLAVYIAVEFYSFEDDRAEMSEGYTIGGTQIGFHLGAQYALVSNSDAALYLACEVGYGWWKSEGTDRTPEGTIEKRDSKSKEYSLNIGPGVEFRVSNWLSISGQYLLTASYSTNTTNMFSTTFRGHQNKLELNRSSIILSFFF